MNKHHYLNQLEQALSPLPLEERAAAITFYAEYFSDAGEENFDQVVQKLGTPAKLAKDILGNSPPTAPMEPTPICHDTDYKNLAISSYSARIIVELGARFSYQIDCDDASRFECSTTNGNLLIKERPIFNFVFIFPSRVPVIHVTMPKNAMLDRVSIDNKSGSVTLSGFACHTLTLNTTSGNLSGEYLQCNSLDVREISGNISFTDCASGPVKISSISGNIKLLNCTGTDLDMCTTSSSVNVEGEFKGNLKICVTSGKIKLALKGKSTDYRKTFRVTSGCATINGTKTKGYAEVDNTHFLYDLSVSAVGGTIIADFT